MRSHSIVYQFGMMFTGNGNVIAFIIAIALVAFLLYMLFRPYKESETLYHKGKDQQKVIS